MIINVNVTTSYHQEYMYSRRIIGFLLVNCTFVRFLTLDQTQPDPPNTENFVTRPEPWVDPTCVQLWSQYTQHKISSGSILIFQEAWSPLFVVSIRGHGTNAGIILPSNKSKNGVCQNLGVCAPIRAPRIALTISSQFQKCAIVPTLSHNRQSTDGKGDSQLQVQGCIGK